MLHFLLVLIILWGVVRGGKAFLTIHPHLLRTFQLESFKKGAAVAVSFLALLFLGRGQIGWAFALGFLAAYLGGIGKIWSYSGNEQVPDFTKIGAQVFREADKTSCFSLLIQITFSSSSQISGQVLRGFYASRKLEDLSPEDFNRLYEICEKEDPPGVHLLKYYLYSRLAGRHFARESHFGAQDTRARTSSPMSEKEAYEILGLKKGASREEISQAHRSLMKHLHPDRGGSTCLAARVNEAKEILIRPHR